MTPPGAADRHPRHAGGKPVRVGLREATRDDHELVWSWHGTGRAPAGNSGRLSRPAHKAWFDAERHARNRLLLIVDDGGRDVGLLRFELEDAEAWLDLEPAPPFPDADASRLAVDAALERVRFRWAPERVIAKTSSRNRAWAEVLDACEFESVRDDAAGTLLVTRELGAPTTDDIQALKSKAWDDPKTAEVYEKRVYRRRGAVQVKNLVEMAYVRRHAVGRILDAGAGTGRFALELQKAPGCDPVAFDYSGPMLEIAHDKSGGTLPAVVGDILRIPFPDRSFDSVVSITVIEHLPRYREAMAELVRVLKPGGTLVFQLRSADHVKRACPEPSFRPSDFVVQLDRDEIEELCRGSGLEPPRIAPYGLFNVNLVLKRRLGRGFKLFDELVNAALTLPGAARAFAALELRWLRRAPLWTCNGLMIVARKPG